MCIRPQSDVNTVPPSCGLQVANTQLAARKRTRQNSTPPPPVPSAGLAQQALEADALRVRQGSQPIFFFSHIPESVRCHPRFVVTCQ